MLAQPARAAGTNANILEIYLEEQQLTTAYKCAAGAQGGGSCFTVGLLLRDKGAQGTSEHTPGSSSPLLHSLKMHSAHCAHGPVQCWLRQRPLLAACSSSLPASSQRSQALRVIDSDKKIARAHSPAKRPAAAMNANRVLQPRARRHAASDTGLACGLPLAHACPTPGQVSVCTSSCQSRASVSTDRSVDRAVTAVYRRI